MTCLEQVMQSILSKVIDSQLIHTAVDKYSNSVGVCGEVLVDTPGSSLDLSVVVRLTEWVMLDSTQGFLGNKSPCPPSLAASAPMALRQAERRTVRPCVSLCPMSTWPQKDKYQLDKLSFAKEVIYAAVAIRAIFLFCSCGSDSKREYVNAR